MKIEKLNKDNIKKFIYDMKIENNITCKLLEDNIDKQELFAIEEDGVYYLGFDSIIDADTISIVYYNSKLSNDKFYDCIEFLNSNLVVNNHLLVTLYKDKYMKLMDEKYKCKEVTMSFSDNSDSASYEINGKEKYAEFGMKSIKYFGDKNMVSCNLVKQNITDENMILDLHNYFKDSGIHFISFFIFNDNFEYMKSLGYQCDSKKYIINSLF